MFWHPCGGREEKSGPRSREQDTSGVSAPAWFPMRGPVKVNNENDANAPGEV